MSLAMERLTQLVVRGILRATVLGLMLGLLLLSSGLTAFLTLSTLLIARETAIGAGDALSRIETGWNALEKKAREKWRFGTKSSLLLNQTQRIVVSYGLPLGLMGGAFAVGIGPIGIFAGLATTLLGVTAGVCLAVAELVYIRNADPSRNVKWEDSAAYREYEAAWEKDPNAALDSLFEEELRSDPNLTQEERSVLRRQWYDEAND